MIAASIVPTKSEPPTKESSWFAYVVPLHAQNSLEHAREPMRQRAREELVLVCQRFATDFTLPVLLFTFLTQL